MDPPILSVSRKDRLASRDEPPIIILCHKAPETIPITEHQLAFRISIISEIGLGMDHQFTMSILISDGDPKTRILSGMQVTDLAMMAFERSQLMNMTGDGGSILGMRLKDTPKSDHQF